MKKAFIILAGLVFLLTACKDKQDGTNMPACINTSINQLAGNSIEVDSVLRYTFNGREVYLMSVSQCCDIPSTVVDANCATVCSLGGFASNYECEGLRFDSTAVFIETVWRR